MTIVWGIAFTDKQVYNLNPSVVAKLKLQEDDIFPRDVLKEMISEKLNIYIHYDYKEQDYIVVGLSWEDFKYEETKADFLNRVKSLIEESFNKEVSLSTFILED